MGLLKNGLGHVHSGWRIVISIFVVVFFSIVATNLISLGISIVLLFLGYSAEKFLSNYFILAILSQGGFLVGALLAFKLYFKKPVKEIGLHRTDGSLHQLTFGLIFGAASISLVYLILLVTGHIKVLDISLVFSHDLLIGLVLFLVVGFSEEILFRGYLMNAFDLLKKPWLTVMLSSVLFSLAHIGNPNLSVLGLFNIGFVGVLFALMFIKTQSLWMPIGFHITWNYFQGNILGLPVSGMDTASIIYSDVVKQDLLSGGAFGPEGGLVATLVICLGFWVLKKYKVNRY